MQSKAAQLAIDIEVEEPTVHGRIHAVDQDAGIRVGDGAIGAVVAGGLDVRGAGNVDDVDLAVDGLGLVLAVAGAAVARQHQELPVGQGVHLGLRRDLGVLGRFGRRVNVRWQGHNVLGDVDWGQGCRDVVLQEARVALCLFL